MPNQTYQLRQERFTGEYERVNRQLNWLSFARLLLFIGIIGFGYSYLVQKQAIWWILALLSLLSFLYCLRLYDVIQARADFAKALAELNGNELAFVVDKHRTGADGQEYVDPHHPYSYDLDLFGPGSLYQFLNRATTRFGRSSLAKALLDPAVSAVTNRQDAVRELSSNLDIRQEVQAAGSIHPVNNADLDRLKDWLKTPPAFNPGIYRGLLIFPLITLTILVLYFILEKENLLTLFFILFVVNLSITFSFARNMTKQMAISGVVTRVLQQFANQFKRIEMEPFRSGLLKDLQSRLQSGDESACQAIQRLARYFKYLDFLLNLVVSVLLNGMFLFHLHVLFALDKWKKKNGEKVMNWLGCIGEFESLSSFANFSFNNKDYCFPALLTEEGFSAVELGHPLISKEKRVNNDISFNEEKFVVLTGSNMSGKSTFLRTLGINLVLARAGSTVCAQAFSFYPYRLHVSMRISDSLQDSESLFYAELKRLKGIIDQLGSGEKTFVILDEILKGTNSNDKHNGTAGLIVRLANYRACGIIATHDLTIADMTASFPGYMTNKCFESIIRDNELFFDYKLKPGVCSRLNASFLMKRMGIIN